MYYYITVSGISSLVAKLSFMASCDAQKTVAKTISRNNQQDVAGTQLSHAAQIGGEVPVGQSVSFIFFVWKSVSGGLVW